MSMSATKTGFEKIYLRKNVFQAWEERMDYVFEEFDNIYISFSGGKDSGLLLNLVMDYMEKRGINRKIGLFHQDFEAQYTVTTEFVTRMFQKYRDRTEQFWFCLPMGSKTNLSNYELFWYPWDPDKKDIWVRPLPDDPAVITLENNPMGPGYYKYKMLQEDMYKQFGRWYRDHCGGGKTVGLIGIRADESLHRYSAIVNKRYPYKNKMWITRGGSNVWSAATLYDWGTEDIWVANGRFHYDYNRIYDLYYKAGVPLSAMRVASPFNEWAAQSLELYRVIEPAVWAKLVGRVQGANFGNIYARTKAMGYKEVKLPPGHTWESYTKFLLETLPAPVRENYLKKFHFSMDFWKTTGGGFDEETIAEIKSKGYKIRRNGVSNFTKDGKSRIVFEQEIPDDTDDVTRTRDIPSWKRMCYCILKNDHYCRFMGFGPDKEAQAKINALKDKYKSIMKGE